MTSTVEIIYHYQKSIDKSLNDESRLLHCITKLYRLPITVQHLQETGIGRTVNSLRKYDGEVGVAAKALVTKWKNMVAEEESEDGTEQAEDHETLDDSGHGEGADSNDEMCLQVDEYHHAEESQEPTVQIDEHNSNHRSGRSVNVDRDSSSSNDRKRSERSAKESSKNPDCSSSSKRKAEDCIERGSSSKDSSTSKYGNDKDHLENREGKYSGNSKLHSPSSSKKMSSCGGDKDRSDKQSSKKSSISSSNISDNSSSSSSKSSTQKKESSQYNERESSQSSCTDKITNNYKHHSSSKEHRKASNGYKKDSENHKRRRSSDEDDNEHRSKKVKNEKSSDKHKSSSGSSSSRSGKDKSTSSRSSSSGKEKSKKSADRKEESSPKKKKPQSDHSDDDDVVGLDSSAGASFADALAMIGMPTSIKKKGTNKSADKIKKSSVSMPPPAAKCKLDISTSSSASNKSSRSSASLSPNSTASSSGYSSCSSTPSLLVQKPKLDPLPEVVEILEPLPVISPHYKPMPLNQTVMECVFSPNENRAPMKLNLKGTMTEEEMFGHSMQSKNMRTKVYSGQKSCRAGVPSLYDLCIRLLQENIDLIEHAGVPYDMLKPVLERATPEQLLNLEEYNPYLMEDTDVLWEQHCKRKFRSQKRKEDECETWREMYIRCSEERESKLISLTTNIKLSQEEKAAPVRKTQLAYVDSTVKPPRNVLSKQAKYGTDRAPVASPAARVPSLKNVSTNVTKPGDTRLKIAPGTRDTAQVQVAHHPNKPKKAPLMAKLMTSIKGFKTGFRR